MDAVVEILEIQGTLTQAIKAAENGMCMAEIDEARSRLWDLKQMLLDAEDA